MLRLGPFAALILLQICACDGSEKCHTLVITAKDGTTTTYQAPTSKRIKVKIDGERLTAKLPDGHTKNGRPDPPTVDGEATARSVSSVFTSYECK